MVTQLRRCNSCSILFRTPTDAPRNASTFYEDEYKQGFITDLPSEHEIDKLKSTDFAATPHSYEGYLALLSILFSDPCNTRILDFGASWGYGTYQLQLAGFRTVGYDVSKQRAAFGVQYLGLEIHSALEALAKPFDVFFSAHVLEHVPKVRETIELARRLLSPGGWFIAFTPNGSGARQVADPDGFHTSWGLVHPQLISADFVRQTFENIPLFVSSSPYRVDELSKWDRQSCHIGSLAGGELFICARFEVN